MTSENLIIYFSPTPVFSPIASEVEGIEIRQEKEKKCDWFTAQGGIK